MDWINLVFTVHGLDLGHPKLNAAPELVVSLYSLR